MGEEVEELADAVEYWKQARYHFGQLVKQVRDKGIDLEDFREEFVESETEQRLMDVVEETVENHR